VQRKDHAVATREEAVQYLRDRLFTTKNIFCNNWLQQKINESPVDREGLSVLQKEAEQAYEQLDAGTLELWRSKKREYSAKRPAIEPASNDAQQKNNRASYASLEAKIDYWCSAVTIQNWVTSRDGY